MKRPVLNPNHIYIARAVATTIAANLAVKYGTQALERVIANVGDKRRKKPVGFAPVHTKKRLPAPRIRNTPYGR